MFVFPGCLLVENSGESVLILDLDYCYLKCGDVISKWVALILV